MSYFAVLHEARERIEVPHCHINVWQLRGWLTTRVVFDVGIALRAVAQETLTADEVKRFGTLRLVLPFLADGDSDIHEVLHDAGTASLVFGQPVHVMGGGEQLDIGGDVWDLTSCGISEDSEMQTDHASVWKLTLRKPVRHDRPVYLRVRFQVKKAVSMWQSDGSGPLLDLRIADMRGAVPSSKWKELEGQVLPLATANVFVIAPATNVLRNSHPAFQYVRLLEGRKWADYLAGLKSSRKMIVYYWRHTAPAVPVTVEKPFRGFLHLTDSYRRQVVRERIVLACLISIATVALARGAPHLAVMALSIWNQVPLSSWLWALAGVIGVVVLKDIVLKAYRLCLSQIRKVRKKLSI
ncbi:MAG: hypothetical protein RLZZ450_307 [Pseudomonadota bacterium]|jgi:hypothetical protein